MKKIILNFILIITATSLHAQVAIGKQSVNGNSTILDFEGNTLTNSPSDQNTTNDKGIILPAVGSSSNYTIVNPTTNNPNNGTFIFDKTLSKVRMFENGQWKDLSEEGDSSKVLNNVSPEKGKGVIIGSTTTTAKGVLVLESTNKAMILPHIKNPDQTVKSPYPGMMCYDTATNSLAVYDGINWNYWK